MDGSVLNVDSECPGRGGRTPAVRARTSSSSPAPNLPPGREGGPPSRPCSRPSLPGRGRRHAVVKKTVQFTLGGGGAQKWRGLKSPRKAMEPVLLKSCWWKRPPKASIASRPFFTSLSCSVCGRAGVHKQAKRHPAGNLPTSPPSSRARASVVPARGRTRGSMVLRPLGAGPCPSQRENDFSRPVGPRTASRRV